MEASIRNALGDIGNRIGLGNIQQLAGSIKNEPLAAAKNDHATSTTGVGGLGLKLQQHQHQQQQYRYTKTSTTKTTLTSAAAKTSMVATKTTTTAAKIVVAKEEEIEEEKMVTSDEILDGGGGGGGGRVEPVAEEDEDEEEEEEIEIDSDEYDDDDEDIMYSDVDSDEAAEEEDEADEHHEPAGLSQAAAAEEASGKIVDIDAHDLEDPQLCADYVREIYAYLIQMERKYRIAPTFLDKKSVSARMRSVLIDWLIQVHMKFQLLQETMYLTVYLIDAYLQRTDVSKMQLQLVGVTAMFLASKYEEMYVPAIDDFVYMTDNTYTKSEIRKMEVNMCKTLEFGFGKPLPLHFLRRYSKAAQADPRQHTLAKYFMELCLHDADFSSMDPSLLAASSLHLSLQLLNGPKWGKTLEFYSGYKACDLEEAMAKIASLTLKAMDLNYKYRAATNKYATAKFLRISLIPELGGKLMRELAAKAPTSQ